MGVAELVLGGVLGSALAGATMGRVDAGCTVAGTVFTGFGGVFLVLFVGTDRIAFEGIVVSPGSTWTVGRLDAFHGIGVGVETGDGVQFALSNTEAVLEVQIGVTSQASVVGSAGWTLAPAVCAFPGHEFSEKSISAVYDTGLRRDVAEIGRRALFDTEIGVFEDESVDPWS